MFDVRKQMNLQQQFLVLLAQLCLSRAYGKIVFNYFLNCLFQRIKKPTVECIINNLRKTNITHLQTVKQN